MASVSIVRFRRLHVAPLWPALAVACALCVIASGAGAAVSVTLPADLTIAPGGEVEVPLTVTNDDPVAALFAKITDVPDTLALVADSETCSARADASSCASHETTAANTINVLVVSSAQATIAPGTGPVMTLRLRDVGEPCTIGDVVTLAFSEVQVSDADNQQLAATAVAGTIRCARGAPVATSPRAKAIDRCQRAVKKAGAQLVAKKLKAMHTCAGRVMKCAQTMPVGAERDACITKAGAKCSVALGKSINVDEDQLRVAIAARCGGPGVLLDDVQGAAGLGYAMLASACEKQLGAPVAGLSDVAACVAAQHACRAEHLVEASTPRAAELMRIAGVSPTIVANLTCLEDHSGGGSGVGDPRRAGKAVTKCASAIAKAGARFVARKLRSLEKCVDQVFTCEQLKPGEFGCLMRAAIKCDGEVAKIATEEARLRAVVAVRCGEGALPFVDVESAAGVGVGLLDATCAPFGVGVVGSITDYTTCLARQHECGVEELLRFEAPRAVELLGLVGHDLTSPFCP